jgi:hypothetical protein
MKLGDSSRENSREKKKSKLKSWTTIIRSNRRPAFS